MNPNLSAHVDIQGYPEPVTEFNLFPDARAVPAGQQPRGGAVRKETGYFPAW